MKTYIVHTDAGTREWQADDAAHACEQHEDAFPDEEIIAVHGEPFILVPKTDN